MILSGTIIAISLVLIATVDWRVAVGMAVIAYALYRWAKPSDPP